MAKFKAARFVNQSVPFVLGTIHADVDGNFEVTDADFIKFLEESVSGVERLDAPKVEKKPVVEAKADAKVEPKK